MNRETIEKAAGEYAEENAWYPGETSYECDIREMEEAFADAYKAGAEWRINSAWHGLDELPVPDKTVIVEYIIDGHAEYVFTHLSENANVVTDEYGFCFYVDSGKITRWAYIDDLLPDGKEE